jgi:hypothetical protein
VIGLMIVSGTFLAGIAAGILLLLRVAGVQEGRNLRVEPPTQAAAAARHLTGLYVQATPALPPARDDGR